MNKILGVYASAALLLLDYAGPKGFAPTTPRRGVGQLWVNLPIQGKMSSPRYQTLL
ncbi:MULTISPECIES: hypothetical protein [Pseudomonas]|uniref:hypothetical protein n=1 Tax=Pseudomonas sp. 10-1B TaxID=1546029 RepID=UPI000A5455CA|nr:hypothetical protein [Pseudomonas sp. 10-1B]